MELGAATSLPSLLLAAYGQKVISTDLKKVLPLSQKCLNLNPDLLGEIEVKELYWGNTEHIAEIKRALDHRIDYIICADLIYLYETFEDLVFTLKSLSLLSEKS